MKFTEETPLSKSVGAAQVVGRERDLCPRSSDTTVHAPTSQFVKAYFLEDRFNNSLLVRRVSKEIQHFKRGERMRRLSSSVASWKRRMPDVPLPNTFVARLVSSFWFECLCALLIVLNTAALTVIVDLQARNRTSTTSNTTLHWLELSFSAWFLLELVLRIVGLRVLFLLGADGLVNCLDLFFVPCFVVLALLAVVIDGEDQSSSGVSYIRVYRFVSFLKVIRFARPLRLLPWARLLAGTLQFCCRFFLPTILLALCLPYVGSLIILSALSYNDSSSDLQEHWGSVFTAMVSLLATSCGGADWDVIGEPLKESWALPYLMMLLHALLFRLVIVNVVACGYLQSTMDQLHLSARHNMHLQLENADTYVARLRDIFRQDNITYEDFAETSKDKRMLRVFEKLGVQIWDADRLMYHLSAGGTKEVALSTMVRGVIMLNDVASKMDTLESQVNVDLAKRKIILSQKQAFARKSTILRSLRGKVPLHVIHLPECAITRRLQALCRVMPFHKEDEQVKFMNTVLAVWTVIRSLHGGAGFVVAPHSGFLSASERNVDFQVVDRSEAFPDGYMTERLRNVVVDSAEFLEALRDFSSHSDTDRWPADHEASSLPKDGFTLVDGISGLRLKCAARMVGLPMPPHKWDNVGTRHLAALAACWAFRLGPSIVMVRSDSGHVHVLHAFDEEHGVVAMCLCDDEPDGLHLTSSMYQRVVGSVAARKPRTSVEEISLVDGRTSVG